MELLPSPNLKLTLKRIRHILEYFFFLFLSIIVRPLSEVSVQILGKKLGTLIYQFGSKRRQIIKTNLDIAFGDSRSKEEKENIGRESIISLTTVVLQCLWLKADPKKRVFQLFNHDPEGLDVIQKCFARNKGVFILASHYGNWEAMGIYHGFLNMVPLHSIVRKLDNPFLEKEIRSFRTLSGNSVFYKDNSPLNLVRTIKKNGCVAVLLDQNTAKGGIFVDFFGKKAATARSIASLSLSTGAAIVPMFCFPQKNGRYKIRYGPEIKYSPLGEKNQDIYNLTQLCTQFIEKEIQTYPVPWMWLHRRWKTRPFNEREMKIYQ